MPRPRHRSHSRPGRDPPPGQKELARLERQIARLSDTEAQLSADLVAHATDYGTLMELGARLRSVQEERAGLEDRWLEVAAELS
jgi:ABC transport system ATP-binding/permease protein